MKKIDLKKSNELLRNEKYAEAIVAYDNILKDNNIDLIRKTINFNREMAAKKLDAPLKTIKGKTELSATQFDVNYYLSENPDVKEAGVDPEKHYWEAGEKEGRKPNLGFDPIFYKRVNADVRAAGLSAFGHFIDFGFKEGRSGCSPSKSDDRIVSTYEKPILFVGHDGVLAGSEIVLLEIIRWFHLHTKRRIKLLLLAPGPVVDRYIEFCDTYVLPQNEVDDPEALKEFIGEDFEFAYLNTVVSGKLFNYLENFKLSLNAPVITHIHEMEKVLETFPEAMQWLLEKTKHWISASPASSKTLIEKYSIESHALTTVPAFINPVARKEAKVNELQVEARKELGLLVDSFVVAGCGTIYERKGPDLFIETAKKLKAKTDKLIEFVWLGAGPDQKNLEEQLTTDEKKWIKFAGNRNNANKLLAAADVFFMSSREDPFPLVVLESAQHGIPTVCFEPATGITAFIEQDAGIAVPEVSTDLAAEAFYRLLERPKLRTELGNKAREKLFANYTTDQQNLKIFRTIQKSTDYKPSVSVIVPFYNHEKFIEERLDSILAQTIKDIEIIALNDCSTDNTAEKVRPYLEDCRVTMVENDTNSGSPFKQWAKGIREAKGDVVWIAEGDDSCANNFLESLLPYFDDPMVNIAGAKTEIIDEYGNLKENALFPYLNAAFPGKFEKSYIKDGFVEINEQLGAMCTLVNASGLLIRKQSFGDTVLIAQDFKMCGDWLIYLECLKGGKIAYDINTINYFRRHSASQVNKVEGTEVYFSERYAITNFVVENFSVSRRLLKKSFSAIDHEWERFAYKNPGKSLSDIYNKCSIREKTTVLERQPHVAFYVHGMMFSKGGIERLASQLANYLVENGWKVTIFCRVHSRKKTVYPLYESVNVVAVFDEHKLEQSVKALNTELNLLDIDVFIPMLSEWLFDPVIEAAQNTGVTIIASEHNDPWKIEELWWSHEKRIACFEKADAIHLLLNKFTESLPEHLHSKTTIIPNGVKIPKQMRPSQKERKIISVGRLEPQKRFDRLIEAVSNSQKILRTLGYKVEIYGEGSLRDDLQGQIISKGVADLVYLQGASNRLDDIYSSADICVISSEFEGFGIVVIEAIASGLPVIGFNECNGPNELIEPGVNGFLVSDTTELSSLFNNLPSLLNKLSREKIYSSANKYSLSSFYENWSKFLKKTLKEKP